MPHYCRVKRHLAKLVSSISIRGQENVGVRVYKDPNRKSIDAEQNLRRRFMLAVEDLICPESPP